ncbi:MAG: SPOR domain-containing protein [Bacteroidales bacterium]
MEISGFIKELLYSHDCVIIPDFGGFIGNYTPARIDRVSGTFHPPVKQISFNRNLNHNDGLLVGKVSSATGLNYGDARTLTGEFVDNMKQKLSRGEKVIFEGIGSFVNNHEGNVQFDPDRETNFHLNSFGLESFTMAPLEGTGSKNILKREENRSSLRKYLWRAAVMVPIIGTLITVPLTTDIFKSRVQTTNLNPLASVEFEKNRQTQQAADNNKDTSVANKVTTTPDETDINKNKAVPAREEAFYYVVAGSFQSESNANVLLLKLTEEGYDPLLLSAPNGFFRVCAYKCSSLAEAEEKRLVLAQKYSGTWIARVKI